MLEDWLTAYTEYTSEQESPALFHFWAGTSVIAATLGRSCYINRGYYTLFPNLYIVFVGASASVRKTTAIHIAYDIFKEAFPDTTLVSQRGTPEAMISSFVEGYKEKGVSEGIIVSDELEVFLGGHTRALDLIQLLTKWYDCPTKFDYRTMMRGKEEMNNVCCNMIAGTTPQGLKEGLPKHAIGGGFTSRVVFVYQSKAEKRVAFPQITEEQKVLRRKLVHDLRVIGQMKGKFKFTHEGRESFEDWYTTIYNPNADHIALDGYYGRKPDTLLKVAMSLSASNSDRMEVDWLELKMGLNALKKNELEVGNIVRLIQTTEVGEEAEKVFRNIGKRGKIDFIQLSRNLSYCMNTKHLEEILSDLLSLDRIVAWSEGGKRWFKVRRD